MTYEEVRERIQTGDVLGVRGRGAFPWLTRSVQRIGGLGDLSGVTHVGVAWWARRRSGSVRISMGST
ncbi:hypothetical protein [Pandoraea sp. CB10b_02]|uniref:hypothetical protein n=1 Tax=Pandoraea sp. CB10b_02 TaxID=2014535 RepID=UPI00257EB911|nr:hypothetical protein [Pandoraea sp. CB10b_02]